MEEDLKKIFGDNLRSKRREKYKNAGHFAKASGIGRSAYYNYETGKAFPDLTTLKKISETLDCSFDELFKPFLREEKQIFVNLLSDLKKIKASKNPDHWHVVNVIIQMAIQIMEDEKREKISISSQSTK